MSVTDVRYSFTHITEKIVIAADLVLPWIPFSVFPIDCKC